jgi:hypothetical protein
MGKWTGWMWGMVFVWLAGASGVAAFQDGASDVAAFRDGGSDMGHRQGSRSAGVAQLPVLNAVRVGDEDVDVDGLASEPAWERAALATNFVQFEPVEGAPATERTEARVLYGDDALYVYLKAYEDRPEDIVAQLTRRDLVSHSDVLGVIIDSYFDRRTAFQFAVNPVGVKQDVYHFDDTSEDPGWDAVWDVETARQHDGWSAEFRIPYSQLRFREDDLQTWGINFTRRVARKQEMAVWAPSTRSQGAIVSRFGELRGLEGIEATNRIEILPYTVAGVERGPGDLDDPFYRPSDAVGAVGADVKYGVTSDLTLDITINPDFGQVEADPAQVNLSAFETFLPEQRPFFVEGSSIFNFSLALGDGHDAVESLFYSRRIGRAPQGSADIDDDAFSSQADRTTIYGAWKLSGKTAGGWSIGALHAITAQERAIVAPSTGPRYHEAVEPLTNYGVLRVSKDFREGRSAVGAVATGTRRDHEIADALELRREAYAGGVDFRHRFAAENWQLSGYVIGSRVTGSPDAIDRAQRSAARYFQRPDAGHLSYDAERTSLEGVSANFGISKNAGGVWRVGTGVQTRSPGFEVNDLGFLNNADFTTQWGWLGWHHANPIGPFRRLFLNMNAFQSWNYGGDLMTRGGNLNANFQLENFWNGWVGVNHELEGLDGRALRGGPMFRREAQTNFWGGLGSDPGKAVQVNVNTFGNVRPESDSWQVNVSPNVRIRPSGRATFNIGAFVNRRADDRQWVRRIETDEDHYLFGRIDQTTAGATLRMDYAFTPTLSLQLYAQPFVSAGTYGAFKQVADPMASRYEDRFTATDVRMEADDYLTDLDGDGEYESFGNPDFNVRQFQSNAVLRWEYRPGSALFVVWSQGRSASVGDRGFDLSRDLSGLFDLHPTNVFMVKLSYWLGR